MRLADVEYRATADAMIAHVSGEIDMSNSAEIAMALAQATPNEALGVVLDLTNVEYLDSAGIHLIYRLRDSLGTRGQQLALVIGRASPVNDALRLAGIAGLIDVTEGVDDALATLGSGEKDTTSA